MRSPRLRPNLFTAKCINTYIRCHTYVRMYLHHTNQQHSLPHHLTSRTRVNVNMSLTLQSPLLPCPVLEPWLQGHGQLPTAPEERRHYNTSAQAYTVHLIKKEMFYGCSTGMGILIYAYGHTSLQIQTQHSKGTGVGWADAVRA